MLDTITDVAVPRWREWAKVTAPTLVLYADGGMFTEEQKTRFVAHRPHVSRINLLDATHDAHLDAFDQWIAALTGFLGAQDRIDAAH
jgi:pimeloyl-ACP methyl ester carboxylesterase